MADSFTDGADSGFPTSPVQRTHVPAVPLLDDPNDDFCRVCGFGVGDMPLLHCMLISDKFGKHSSQS